MPVTPRLAGLSAGTFLRRHWQKAPLLARSALPECAALLGREQLFDLAGRDDLESRLVHRHGARWRVEHGPFAARRLRRLPASGWTLLVQGVNHALPAAQRLLVPFSFIPYARFDDVMASYAPPGGGVGPHFDDYDVFLLQGTGRRRWRISHQRDLALIPGAPLKVLRRFRPSREWVLGSGDMLYLPPRWAHDGTAVGEDCVTYSIGFRAPHARELAAHFLEYLQDELRLEGLYADPGLRPARRPARLDDRMVRGAAAFIDRIRWAERDVARFLGRHLTEPRAHVVFARPGRPVAEREFRSLARLGGIRLAPATRALFRGRTLFMNGEAVDAGAAAARLLSLLCDRRSLPAGTRFDAESARRLYRWYRAGYIHIGDS